MVFGAGVWCYGATVDSATEVIAKALNTRKPVLGANSTSGPKLATPLANAPMPRP